jgi:hypothetical protein
MINSMNGGRRHYARPGILFALGWIWCAAAAVSFGRESWLLNGDWDFVVAGESPHSPPPDGSGWIKLRVPSVYTAEDAQLAQFDGVPEDWRKPRTKRVGWYRRKLPPLPGDAGACRWFLRAEQVTFAAVVYINGHYAGEHVGSEAPFELEIGKWLRTDGENEVVFAILGGVHFRIGTDLDDDPKVFAGEDGPPARQSDTGEVNLRAKKRPVTWYDNPAFHNPQRGLGDAQGIPGDVWLESLAGPLRIVKSKIETPLDGGPALRVRHWVENPTGRVVVARLEQTVFTRDGAPALQPGPSEARVMPGEIFEFFQFVRWPEAKLWGSREPFGTPELYQLRVSVASDGRICDEAARRFGVREFAAGNPLRLDAGGRPQSPVKVYFNNREFFLQGENIGSVSTGVYAYNRPLLTRLYGLYQNLGVTNARFHTHQVLPPLFYDVADELGFMVQDNFPLDRSAAAYLDWKIPPDADARRAGYFDHLRRQMRAWIEAKWNHPSIIAWVPENEVISHGRNMPDRAGGLAELNRFLQGVDNSRPLINEGSFPLRLARYRDAVPVAALHYPFGRFIDPETGVDRRAGLDWRKAYMKPVYIGEDMDFDAFLRLLQIRGNKYKDLEQEKADIRLMAGDFTRRLERARKLGFSGFAFWNIELYGFSGGGERGPWDVAFPERKKMVGVDWPAMSGTGARIDRMCFGILSAEPKYNWFDPARPFVTPTVVADAVKAGYGGTPYAPRVEGCFKLSPEVIIATGRPFAWVRAVPSGGIVDRRPLWIQADADGRAWFVLPQAGEYEFNLVHDGGAPSLVYSAKWVTSVPAEPGYNNIPVAHIGR